MKQLYVVGAKAAIRNEDNKLLVLERYSNKHMWDLPGGSVETDDSIYNTLIRELEDELPGISNIRVGNLVNTFDTGITIANVAKLIYMIYDVKATLRKPIKLSSEHYRYAWIDCDLTSIDQLTIKS